MADVPTILTVHAHPDDEASKGAPTLAKYHAEGVRTILVCCTGGEEGDLQNPTLRAPGQPFHGLSPEEEKALVADLEAMGYCVCTPEFQYGGRTLRSVIADLPGEGHAEFSEEFRERLRDLLREETGVDPGPDWEDLLTRLFGRDWVEGFLRALGRPLENVDVERLALLFPDYPWWRWEGCPLPAPGAELVLVGCHLDSTAAAAVPYDPAVDPAPGADDDGTGIAAVLAIARQLIKEPRLAHTVRFCFFNAEEQGLFGSQQHANFLKEIGATVRAAICLDMLGYNADPARIFEIHAGYTDVSVRDASVTIADLIVGYSGLLDLIGKGLLPQTSAFERQTRTKTAPFDEQRHSRKDNDRPVSGR